MVIFNCYVKLPEGNHGSYSLDHWIDENSVKGKIDTGNPSDWMKTMVSTNPGRDGKYGEYL